MKTHSCHYDHPVSKHIVITNTAFTSMSCIFLHVIVIYIEKTRLSFYLTIKPRPWEKRKKWFLFLIKTSFIQLMLVHNDHVPQFPLGVKTAHCQLLRYKHKVKTLSPLWVYLSCSKACS